MRALLLLAVTLLGLPAAAFAQPNRVFASARSGSDLNSCSDVATPCQSLQGAVNQVAAGGVVLVLDTGGYGPLVIDKAVTIDAPAGVEAFIHPPSGNAITVQAGGGDVVVLRGLTLSVGTGYGVHYLSGAALHVERCVIQGFHSGIVTEVAFADLYVEDTVIRSCGFRGIFVLASGTIRVTLERCHLVRNYFGLVGGNSARVAASGVLAALNAIGMVAGADTAHASQMVIERCVAHGNSVRGIAVYSGDFDSPATLWVSNSTATANGDGSASSAGLEQDGVGQLFSRLNNTVEGNPRDTFGSIGMYTPK